MAQSGMMQQALRGMLDPESRFKADEKTGRHIYVTAWTVEILAALIGLFIAWTQAYRALYNIPNPVFNDYVSAILGALPFILIAIIEPMKIPLASGVYRVKQIGWKMLILSGLLCLTFVTFETMFTGLETQNYNVTRLVTNTNIKIQKVENDLLIGRKVLAEIEADTKERKIKDTEKQISLLRDGARQKLESIKREIEARVGPLKEQKITIQKQINELSTLNATQAKNTESSIKLQIENLQNARRGMIQRRDAEINSYKSSIKEENKFITKEKEDFYKNKEQTIISLRREISSLNDSKDRARVEFNEFVTKNNRELRTRLLGVDKSYEVQEKECNFSCGEVRSKKQAERETVQNEIKNQINLERKNYDAKIENNNQKIKEINNKIDAISKSKNNTDQLKSFDQNKIDEIVKRFRSQISEIDQKIEKINSQLTSVREQASGLARAQISRAEKDIQLIDQQIKDIQNSYDDKISDVSTDANDEVKKIQDARKIELDGIDARRKRIGDLKKSVLEKEEERARLIGIKRDASMESNIYRVTASVYGVEDIVDVKPEQLKWVSGIWFGSIAFIAATVGTVLALISFILRDPKAFEQKERWYRTRTLMKYIRLGTMRIFMLVRALVVLLLAVASALFGLTGVMRGFFGKPLQRSLRGLSASFRRRLNAPKIKYERVEKEVVVVKEVIKEVPVDRVVTVEVPVEVVRERVVHVPIASDDLSVLNIQGRDKDGK